jgi:large repetitive protein
VRATTWWTRGRSAIASATALVIAVGVPLSIAVLHKGFPVTDVELTTRDVWVTNGDDVLAGRLNRQIEELDAAVAGATPSLDVVQNGTDVFLFDTDAGSLERIDPAFTRLSERVDLPSRSVVRLGGTTLAILDGASGDLWVVDVSVALDYDPVDEPTLELGPDAAVAVSPDGTVFATSPADQLLYTIAAPGARAAETALDFSPEHQLTAVGERAVILDTDTNTVVRDDGSTVQLGSQIGLKLQQAGADNDFALVATGDGLLRVPLGAGSTEVGEADIARTVTSSEGVSSPVWLDGCAHGAWGGAQRYELWCDTMDPQVSNIDQQTGGDTLEFRVNRSVIALNNLSNGNVWLVDNEMRLVENWDEVTPPLEDETEEGDEKSSVLSFEDTLAERTDINTVPLARDDEFGVRAGRTTILPLIENDSDPDGDVLTVTDTTGVTELQGTLDLIDGGRALQFTPAAGASNASFSYTIDDGRGGVAQAYVAIRVVPQGENATPVEKRSTTLSVEAGGSIEYNVLTDWADPDGDDLTLVGASPTSGDEVRFTPDGFITFTSRTSEVGSKEVRLTISDGVLETTGTFAVEVAAAGTLSPIGAPDFAQVFVNDDVVIEPTKNDIAPGGGHPNLLGVDKVPSGTTATANLELGKVTFSSTAAGTYYFLYSLGAGAATSIGIVRVDVLPDPEVALAPIAVKDTAYLRPGEPTLVKVLANDVSPGGLVLAVQSTDTTTTDGALTVEVLNNTTVRITATNALVSQTQFSYTISDGAQTALAGVTVVPVPPIVNRQPPVAVDDRITVRAGDYVSVDVLANDYHPDDSQVLLEPALADTESMGEGALAFVNSQRVRYQASTTPGDYTVIYRIADQFGESATATVTFSVIAPVDDPNDNVPPSPEPQTARVFAGASVPITIPLDGIDPDGDSVLLSKITNSGTKGTVSDQTLNSFVYTASVSDAGTDTLYYEVEDTYGAKAIGKISIGVIPRTDEGEPPAAIDDTVEIRPGRTATVQVLLNDSDPAGYPLSVTDISEMGEGIAAEIDGDSVVISAPKVEGSFSIRYTISNGNAGVDSAFILVNVTEDATPLYPVATDYYVPVNDVVDTPDAVLVDLDGLIANPSGRADELEITVDGPNADRATVDQDAQTITVAPSDRRVAIAYTVTNADDGLSGSAFIIVPPAVSANFAYPPFLDPDLPQQVVAMNGTIEWDLADILIVPSGRDAILTEASAVQATNSNGESLYVDADTLRFSPGTDYRGISSITFTVTDGTSKDDVNGLQNIITMPVMVGNPDFSDTPPVFVTQNVTIEAGNDATQIDLRASTSHPNPTQVSQFSYTGLTGVTSDIEASISDGTLSVASPLGVQPNTKTVLNFSIKYKDFTVPGSVTVTTVPSTKPYPVATMDDDEGQRSVAPTTYFNVLDNDINPFGPGSPLTVESATIVSAGTGASLEWHPDGRVKVTPGPTFHGYVEVQYRVQDASLEPSRQVTGTYRLNVRDRPDKMVAPVATPGDLQATVTWTAPETNGEAILYYTVTWSPPQGVGGGSYTANASEATHTVTGLTNGTDYTFRVTATNELGTSDISNASAAARPKGQASPPTTVNITATTTGNGTINLSWSGAGANGGDITGYDVAVFQGSGATPIANVAATGTSASWQGTVGVAYTYSVRALATGGDSVASTRSAAATPAPGQPGVSLTNAGGAGNYTMNGSYSAAAANGVPAGNVIYSWTVSSGLGSGSQAAPYSFSVTGGASTSYTLTVTATVGGVSNSASVSRTTPAAPQTSWAANAGSGTCPEKRNASGTALNAGTHFNSSGPSCSSAHGFANNWLSVYCYSTYTTTSGTGKWYEFSGDGYSRAEGWLVKGDTLLSIDPGAPPC